MRQISIILGADGRVGAAGRARRWRCSRSWPTDCPTSSVSSGRTVHKRRRAEGGLSDPRQRLFGRFRAAAALDRIRRVDAALDRARGGARRRRRARRGRRELHTFKGESRMFGLAGRGRGRATHAENLSRVAANRAACRRRCARGVIAALERVVAARCAASSAPTRRSAAALSEAPTERSRRAASASRRRGDRRAPHAPAAVSRVADDDRRIRRSGFRRLRAKPSPVATSAGFR